MTGHTGCTSHREGGEEEGEGEEGGEGLEESEEEEGEEDSDVVGEEEIETGGEDEGEEDEKHLLKDGSFQVVSKWFPRVNDRLVPTSEAYSQSKDQVCEGEEGIGLDVMQRLRK